MFGLPGTPTTAATRPPATVGPMFRMPSHERESTLAVSEDVSDEAALAGFCARALGASANTESTPMAWAKTCRMCGRDMGAWGAWGRGSARTFARWRCRTWWAAHRTGGRRRARPTESTGCDGRRPPSAPGYGAEPDSCAPHARGAHVDVCLHRMHGEHATLRVPALSDPAAVRYFHGPVQHFPAILRDTLGGLVGAVHADVAQPVGRDGAAGGHGEHSA